MQNGWEEYRGFANCPAHALQFTAQCVWSLLHPHGAESRRQPPAIPGCRGLHQRGCAQGFACRPRLAAAGEGAVDRCAPGQPVPALALLTLDASASTAYLKTF